MAEESRAGSDVVHFRELVDREERLSRAIVSEFKEIVAKQGEAFSATLDHSLRQFGHDIAEKLSEMTEEDRKRLRELELENARLAERQKIADERMQRISERLTENEHGDETDSDTIKDILKRMATDRRNPNGRLIAYGLFAIAAAMVIAVPPIRHVLLPFLPF